MASAISNCAGSQEYEHDVLMIGCDNVRCHEDGRTIHSALQSRGYVINRMIVCAGRDARVLKQSVEKALCTVLISCSHILGLKSIKELITVLKLNDFINRVVVAGRTFKSSFRDFDRVKLKSQFDFETCIQTVSRITKSVQCRTENEYQPLEKVEAEETPYYEETRPKSGCSETFCKRLPSHQAIDHSLFIQSVTDQSIFVQSDTLVPVEGNRGTFVLESFTKPAEYASFTSTGIIREFNSAGDRKLQELSKYVMCVLIPKCKLEENVLGLVNLLKLDDDRIQTKVVDTIKDLQFDSDIRCAKAEDYFEGIDISLQLLEQRSSSHSFVTKIVPVVMNSISILYLKTIIQSDVKSISDRLKAEKYDIYLRGIEMGDQNTEYRDYVIALKEFVAAPESVSRKKSFLNLGNWKDALMDDRNCKKLLSDIVKMSYLEQYACVFGIVNQLCLYKVPQNLKMTKLFEDILRKLVAFAISKKKETTIYPILNLATQCIGHLFKTYEDDNLEFIEVLKLYLDNAKILQARRECLLGEVEPLLFHKNKEVAKEVVCLFRNNGCTEVSVQRRIVPYIERLLLTSSLKIMERKPSVLHSAPEWHCLDATLCGTYNVKLNVLFPTQNCLSAGCMNDYKHKADDRITKRNITTLEVLRHLQKTGCHSNVIRLIAYQFRPLPLFYVVENIPGQSFQSFLLSRRKNQDWLSQAELGTFVAEIVGAVAYLHSKNVIHRDLTTTSFSLRTDRTVVLTALKIARRIDCECTYASDFLCQQMPIRWISPESILEDKYDRKTDIWMLGPLIYEIFTHGCHPYTELYNQPTEKILEWVVFQELKLQKWPCIPRGIHDTILSCVQTEPQDRTELDTIINHLNNQLANEQSPKWSLLSSSFSTDNWYPDLDLRQQNQSEPERGLPKFLADLKQSAESPRLTYINIRKSRRMQISTGLVVKESDLLTPDQPVVHKKPGCLQIEEPVSEKYLETIMPQITVDLSYKMGIYSWPPDKRHSTDDKIGKKRVLVFRCQKARRLTDVAASLQFGNPHSSANKMKYVEVILEMVKFVRDLHSQNWIHRDICCRSIYMTDPPSPGVFSPRLGRMCRLNQDNMSDDCVQDRLFLERINWMPIEVLLGYHERQKSICQYSKESDIYMLGCTTYEFFKLLEIRSEDPMASDLGAVPFATLSKPEIFDHLFAGEHPQQPIHCPSWLYDLMILCWNRERTRRPSADYLIHEISQRFKVQENHYAEPDYNEENRYSLRREANNSSDDYPKTDTEYEVDSPTSSGTDGGENSYNTKTHLRSLRNSVTHTEDPSKPPLLPPRNYPKSNATENPTYEIEQAYGNDSAIESNVPVVCRSNHGVKSGLQDRSSVTSNSSLEVLPPSSLVITDSEEDSETSGYLEMSLKDQKSNCKTKPKVLHSRNKLKSESDACERSKRIRTRRHVSDTISLSNETSQFTKPSKHCLTSTPTPQSNVKVDSLKLIQEYTSSGSDSSGYITTQNVKSSVPRQCENRTEVRRSCGTNLRSTIVCENSSSSSGSSCENPSQNSTISEVYKRNSSCPTNLQATQSTDRFPLRNEASNISCTNSEWSEISDTDCRTTVSETKHTVKKMASFEYEDAISKRIETSSNSNKVPCVNSDWSEISDAECKTNKHQATKTEQTATTVENYYINLPINRNLSNQQENIEDDTYLSPVFDKPVSEEPVFV